MKSPVWSIRLAASCLSRPVGFEDGDQVVVVGGWGDGTCRHCQEGDTQICGHGRWPGFGPYGGYSEFVPVPARYLVKVDKRLKAGELAPLTDAGLTPYHGIKKLRNAGALGAGPHSRGRRRRRARRLRGAIREAAGQRRNSCRVRPSSRQAGRRQ